MNKQMIEYEEWEHETAAKQYIKENFSHQTQIKAMKTIKEMLDDGKDWCWIHYALKKKSPSSYETFGFGLWFSYKFNGCVYEAINRDREIEEINYEDVLDWLNDCPNEDASQKVCSRKPDNKASQIDSLPRLQKTQPNGQLEPYQPLDELADYYNADIYEYMEWLSQSEKNREYIDYEMKRLSL